jgi:hypothetical protein
MGISGKMVIEVYNSIHYALYQNILILVYHATRISNFVYYKPSAYNLLFFCFRQVPRVVAGRQDVVSLQFLQFLYFWLHCNAVKSIVCSICCYVHAQHLSILFCPLGCPP